MKWKETGERKYQWLKDEDTTNEPGAWLDPEKIVFRELSNLQNLNPTII